MVSWEDNDFQSWDVRVALGTSYAHDFTIPNRASGKLLEVGGFKTGKEASLGNGATQTTTNYQR